MHDHHVSSWINERGETIFELAIGGVLITYKEGEQEARSYLSEASLNKKDVILDFSLVPIESPLPCPREMAYLKVALQGISGELPVLQGPGQEAAETQLDGRQVAMYQLHCRNLSAGIQDEGLIREDRQRLLLPSFHMESDHPEIIKTADAVTAGASSTLERVKRLVHWVSTEVEDEVSESTSALEVLRKRKGECQAHTLLYAALARAQGIFTRLAGGLVYMEGMGFLYHSWAESHVGGWIAVDPALDQVGVDATHIKLVEGDSWLSILKLADVVGRISLQILEFKAPCEGKDP
jgi:transglutaminase-like putative cysteine protease